MRMEEMRWRKRAIQRVGVHPSILWRSVPRAGAGARTERGQGRAGGACVAGAAVPTTMAVGSNFGGMVAAADGRGHLKDGGRQILIAGH